MNGDPRNSGLDNDAIRKMIEKVRGFREVAWKAESDCLRLLSSPYSNKQQQARQVIRDCEQQLVRMALSPNS